jgi:protein subunit release factor A
VKDIKGDLHIHSSYNIQTSHDVGQNSYKECRTTIEDIIKTNLQKNFEQEISLDRKYKVGSGMRGDKIRTYRFQDDIVQDHNTNKKSTCKKVLNGNFELLW